MGTALDEYRETSANVRMYALMRNGQLAICCLLTAALVIAFVLAPGPDRHVFAVAGIVFSAAFWVMEERAADHWLYYRLRAVELEKILGFSQYTGRPARSPLSVTNAFRAIHLGVALLWVALLWLQLR